MSMRRGRPTLYEVVNRNKRESGWRRRRTTPANPTPSPNPGYATTRSKPTPAPAPTPSPAPAPPAPATRPSATETPLKNGPAGDQRMRFTNGELQLRLGIVGITAVAIVLVSLLAVMFQVGSRAANQPEARPADDGLPFGNDDTATGPSEVAVPSNGARTPIELPQTAAKSEPHPRQAPAELPRWEFEKGHTYVVIQHFPKSKRRAAEAVQAFLKQNNVDCIIKRGSDVRVISREGYDLKTASRPVIAEHRRALDRLKQKVKEVGHKYVQEFKGGYALDQCYLSIVRP